MSDKYDHPVAVVIPFFLRLCPRVTAIVTLRRCEALELPRNSESGLWGPDLRV